MRILFAEDDRQLRSTVSRGLREASYVVDVASNGAQAVSMASSSHYDAIVLDILMPVRDGISVCRSIRDQGSRVPILMLTALDSVEQRIHGLDSGADDYLTKPFAFGELLARLRALIRRNEDALGDELRVADLVVDTQRRRVRRKTRNIELSGKEFAFLVLLARNAGRVVSRGELVADLWEDSQLTSANLIDVYASRLRRKIDDGEDVALFRTLRGIGYMLEPPAPNEIDKSTVRHARRKS
ncbi:MAG TPA: response regulator transcription factor [Gemmatimonadaceae bacterium]|nr:response regulator transcription factor [Gemmatimonadaceae bacterium]